MRTRLIERVGTRYTLRKEWGTCPTPASEFSERHEGTVSFDTDHVPPPSKRYTDMPDQDDPHYDAIIACDQCGEEAPSGADASHLTGSAPIYDTPDGEPRPGFLYFVTHDPDDWCWFGWDNCDGEHLHCVLPNGQHWPIDQRASNCTRLRTRRTAAGFATEIPAAASGSTSTRTEIPARRGPARSSPTTITAFCTTDT